MQIQPSRQIIENELRSLFIQWCNESVQNITLLPSSGSYREYYRLESPTKSAIGAYNADIEENKAFITFTNHFLKKALPVPQLYAVSADETIYIIEDLGDITLLNYIEDGRKNNILDEKDIVQQYKKILDVLLRFQFDGGNGLDYTVAYPRESFDHQSMMWDLNYFKYYVVKLFKLKFNEQRLEHDFYNFIAYLVNTDSDYFLYRDFQSRNIMIKNSQYFFIDYQGGRRGALQYDLASLLFEAKANLGTDLKNELFTYYVNILKEKLTVDIKEFEEKYYAFALIRIMQALGAYGFRGVIENKPLFIESIPPALKNLNEIMNNITIMNLLPEFKNVFHQLIHHNELLHIKK